MIHHIKEVQGTGGISIFCFGDLQFGSPGFSEEAWEQFVGEFKSTKNAYALGLGDYSDWLRPSMRARLLQPLAHDDSARQQLDDSIRDSQDKLLKKLSFMEGKCIGIHSGHHEWEWASGGNSTQRVASALKAPYLGWIASTRLSVTWGKPKNNTKTRSLSYTIVSTHGNSNARKVGPTASWLEGNIANSIIADHYVMGHGCKSVNFIPHERNHIRTNGPAGMTLQIPRCLIVGGFNKGYTNGWESSYVERNGFSPQPLGWGIIRLNLLRNKAGAGAKGIKPGSQFIDVDQLNRIPPPSNGD